MTDSMITNYSRMKSLTLASFALYYIYIEISDKWYRERIING